MATELPTVNDLLATTQQSLRTSIDPQGTGAINLNPGSRLDILQSATLAINTRNTAHIADRAAARSVHTSVGEDLDSVGADIYNTSRKASNPATGTVYLQRPGTGATVIPAGQRFSVPAGANQPSVTYFAPADVPVISASLKVAVPIQAAVDGVVGIVPLAAITAITDPLPDTTWALYVPTFGDPVLGGGQVDVIAGGDDGEVGNDDAFRARLLKSSFAAATSPGTRAGVQATLLALPGIFDVTLVEAGDGSIRIFCGDANYLLSNALKTSVLNALEGVRAFGNPGLVYPYTVVNVFVTGSIFMNLPVRNYTESSIKSQALANVLDYFKTQRENPDSYFLSAIISALKSAHPEVQSATLSSPVADIKPLAPASYAGVQNINRYVTSSAFVSLAVLDPQTQ